MPVISQGGEGVICHMGISTAGMLNIAECGTNRLLKKGTLCQSPCKSALIYSTYPRSASAQQTPVSGMHACFPMPDNRVILLCFDIFNKVCCVRVCGQGSLKKGIGSNQKCELHCVFT